MTVWERDMRRAVRFSLAAFVVLILALIVTLTGGDGWGTMVLGVMLAIYARHCERRAQRAYSKATQGGSLS